MVDGVSILETKAINRGLDREGYTEVNRQSAINSGEDSEEGTKLQYFVAHAVCGFEVVVALEVRTF